MKFKVGDKFKIIGKPKNENVAPFSYNKFEIGQIFTIIQIEPQEDNYVCFYNKNINKESGLVSSYIIEHSIYFEIIPVLKLKLDILLK